MKIKLINRWDDVNLGDRYVELRLGTGGACCVKDTPSGYRYILECYDGNEVYSYVGGADFPLRKLTDEEHAMVMEFVKEQFKVEKKCNRKAE